MWLKPYLSSITWHYMSLKAKESVWHSDYTHKISGKKEIVKESVVPHIIRDL